MNEPNNENEMDLTIGNENESNRRGNSVTNKAVNKAVNKATKKATKEVTKKAASAAAKKSLFAAAAPVLTIIAIIVLLIVITVGVAVFLKTLPGIAMEKLKAYGKHMANGLASWFGANSAEQVDDKLIYDTLTYLEQIGYDLKGYGFVTEYMGAGDVGDNQYLDEDAGVVKDKDTDEIKKAKSDFIMAYLVSDNYIYTLANSNLDTSNFGGSDFISWLIQRIIALGKHFEDFFGGSLGAHWTTGLITLWHEGPEGLGYRGDYYSSTGFFNFDDVKLDPEKRELIIKKGSGTPYKFKLDGWTGRYGMPMEFLLSVHLATMMPDLAYDMANTFETKVNILLYSPDDETYVPYIENVINHWYRNVYYTNVDYNKNNDKAGHSVNFVDYDYAYEDVMKERWTLYETDDNGEYILYVLSDNGDGEYATSASDVNDYTSSHIESNGGYYVYKGTREEAMKENVAVTKKAVTINDGESEYTDKLEDFEWSKSNKIWTAYEKVASNIVQKGDAVRGETNSEIKKMFLQNTYFKYDGTQEKAEAIKKFRDDYHVGYGSLNASSELNPDNVDLTGISTDVTTDSGTTTFKASEVSGKVMLNQDSLNTFSMLENTETLDADYIYRDFKELVVELGYFEKEEVTDETPRLLAWIIPEIGSYGFPKRELDKVDNEFGTMAHSRLDYLARDNAIYWNDPSDDYIPEEGGSGDVDPENEEDGVDEDEGRGESTYVALTNDIQSVSGKKRNLLAGGGVKITNNFIESDMEDVDMVVRSWAEKFKYTTASNYYHKDNESEYMDWLESLGGVFSDLAGEKTQGEGDGDSFIDAEKYVYGLMWIAGFEYCAGTCDKPSGDPGSKGGSDRCDPIIEAQGGDAANIKYDAYNDTPGVHHSHVDLGESDVRPFGKCAPVHIDEAMLAHNFTTNCNHTTDKVYYKAGLFGDGHDNRPSSSCSYKSLVNKYGAKIITDPKELHMGDLIECFDDSSPYWDPNPSHWTGWSHVFFVGNEDDDYLYLYETGHDFTHDGDFVRREKRDCSRSDIYGGGWVGLHLWDLQVNKEKYQGFKGNEAVVSPVTGVLLEYGTYTEDDDERINVDIRYDNLSAEMHSQGIDFEYAIRRQEYKDQVGYAKIMVLDAKNYKKLEASVDSKWKNNSLIESTEGSGTFKFREELSEKEELEGWSQKDKTIYGYKEFVEKYEKYGIAGNIIYIDGFKCETVDKGFHDGEGQYPEGDEIKMSDFDVSQNDLTDEVDNKKTKYKKESKYHTVSKKEEDRINAEAAVKKKASPSIGANGLIFIKEGTVLGRTMTDRELIVKERKEELGTYQELRVVDIDATTDYKVIGNYIRMIMRDKSTDTVVENIEDYMKLDDGKKDTKEKELRIQDDYDVTDETNFPTLDEFKMMFADCPIILENAEAFIAMQSKYGINAAFAACVTIIESSGGTNGELVGNGNGYPYNWFSISGSYNGKSYTTQNGRTWRAYDSYAEAVDDFGSLIKNGSCYVPAGRRRVGQIGEKYCVPPDHWIEAVNNQLKERYAKVPGTEKEDS